MKNCPQCNTVYDEDYIFCLTDGNALLDNDDEQETVLNRKFSMPPIASRLLQMFPRTAYDPLFFDGNLKS